jgi:stage III sporulation protein AA
VISAPGGGKTTLLRDLIRSLSDGSALADGMKVGVVDERSEIAGCYMGVPQNQVGIRTDVLDACPKTQGMMMLIRSMSPDLVAIDELGGHDDIMALKKVLHCGCKVLVTIHGEALEEVTRKKDMEELISAHIFERFVVIRRKKEGRCFEILGEDGMMICSV